MPDVRIKKHRRPCRPRWSSTISAMMFRDIQQCSNVQMPILGSRESCCNGLFNPCVQDSESTDILCRLHPVGKLKVGFDHLPGGLLQLGPVMTARGVLPERRVVHLGHLPLREVARAGPCLGLVAHDGAHEPEQRTLRREDLHHARAALYLEFK